MTYQTIFAASSFLLIAFAIEQVCRQRGIPSVIVLVLGGLLARPVLNYYGFEPDGINTLVPIVGAVGLVLIVLEGALDIDLRRDHLRVLATTSTTAILSIALCILLIYPFAVTLLSLTFVQALLIATPFAVISSAVAISGSSVLNKDDQEFVVYESSISDILGVLLFFALLGSNGTFSGILLSLVGGGLISILLSIISAVVLVLLLLRTDSHIRFTPLLAGLFALYALGELLHFSPLIMVLMLGLLLNKPTVITRFKVFRHWVPADYSLTLSEFRTLVLELTFVVRGFFFVLLGYWTDPRDFLSIKAWLATIIGLAIIYAVRVVLLRLIVGKERTKVLLWFAPRGLITVLLFIYAKESFALPQYLTGSVMLIVLISSFLMMLSKRFVREETQGQKADVQTQNT
ncbi:MAG: sodium:proton antiporter [Gammaproteobacteria bacterium]|nr:sodium:proton antiporter [Gammaproteobacteria bacterium]